MSNLRGEYQFANSDLHQVGTNLHLVIGTRQKPTPQKPQKYLLQRVSSKQHIYISSLFKWQEIALNESTEGKEWFTLDWQGINYVLMLDHTQKTAKISVLDQMPVKGVVRANDL